MDAEGLKLKIDSKGAQQDLIALSKILDRVENSANKLDRAFQRMASSTEANLSRAAGAIRKYSEAAALLMKIKSAGNPVGHIQELAKALDSVGRARGINNEKIASIRALGHALQTLRAPQHLSQIAGTLNALGSARIPTQAQARNLHQFLSALGSFKGTANVEQVSRMLTALAGAKGPSESTVRRLEQTFRVLSSMKEIPGASRIANQLDTITAAANRAAVALNKIPGGGRGMFSMGGGAPRAAASGSAAAVESNALSRSLRRNVEEFGHARSSFMLTGRSLSDLSGRFRLGYQAGTLFSTMFASFTMGTFVRSLYDINIQLLKLQKAVLFATGTFKGADEATSAYIAISQYLGLSIKDNIETYGRFVIAATASGLKLKQTNEIYTDLATALVVVGASAKQQQLAFYGLTEMMQKGVVYSKEFNRQIGAQLPGNAVVGAAALSKLQHKFVSVSDFFRQMHSGTLLSASFVPEWARQVKQMYQPLLALAQQRPDVAIQRLKNTFVDFARQVGSGKFMSSIGSEMKRLTDMIVTGDGANAHLTAGFQHLADSIGQGLATAIHGLGNGLAFIIAHFDTLFTLLKGFLALKFAETFAAMGQSLVASAAKMFGFARATHEAAIEEKNLAANAQLAAASVASSSQAAAAAAIEMSPAATAGAAAFGFFAPREKAFGTREATSAFQRASLVGSSVRFNGPTFNRAGIVAANTAQREPYGPPAPYMMMSGPSLRKAVGPIAESESLGARVLSGAGGAAKALGTGSFGLFKMAASGLGAVLEHLGPIAMGATLALAMFGDKLAGIKTAKGADVTYNDVALGVFKDVTDSVAGLIASLGESFGMFGKSALSLGKIILGLAAVTKATFSLVADLAHALGATLGTVIAKVVAEIVAWGRVIGKLMHGDFAGAAFEYAKGNKQQAAIGAAGGKTVGDDFRAIAGRDSIQEIYARMEANSENYADARGGEQANRASQKQMEAALQQNAAAKANMDAATLFSDTMAELKSATERTSWADLQKDIGDLTSGRYARSVLGAAGLGVGQKPAIPNMAVPNDAAAKVAATHVDNEGVAVGTASRVYATAAGYQHENEHSDKASLQQLFRGAGFADVDPEKTAWCAAFVNSVLATQGIQGTGKLNASSFKNWGQPVSKPEKGDVVVMRSMSAGDSGHVGFFDHVNKNGSVAVLGGNQHDEVNVSNFNPYDVIGYRRPTGANIGTSTAQARMQNAVAELDSPQQDVTGQTPTSQPQTAAQQQATKILTEKAKLNSILSVASPAAAAVAQDEERRLKLRQLINEEEQNVQKLGKDYKSIFLGLQAEITAAANKSVKDMNDAVHPVQKAIRLQQEENAVTLLRVQGKEKEADWQQRINQYTEEGYSLSLAIEKADRDNLETEKGKADVMSAQLELAKQKADLEVKHLARLSTNPVDDFVNQQILAHMKPGQTLEQARQDQAGSLDTYRAGGQANTAGTHEAGLYAMKEEIDKLRNTANMDSDGKKYMQSYIDGLQKFTGLQTNDLAKLQSEAGEVGKAAARSYADAKKQFEEPPALQRWADALEPVQKKLDDMTSEFIDKMSDGLAQMAVGKKVDFREILRGMSQDLIKNEIQNSMKGLLGIFGGVKKETPEEKMQKAGTTQLTAGQIMLAAGHAMQAAAAAKAVGGAAPAAGAAASGAASSVAASGASAVASGAANAASASAVASGAASAANGAAKAATGAANAAAAAGANAGAGGGGGGCGCGPGGGGGGGGGGGFGGGGGGGFGGGGGGGGATDSAGAGTGATASAPAGYLSGIPGLGGAAALVGPATLALGNTRLEHTNANGQQYRGKSDWVRGPGEGLAMFGSEELPGFLGQAKAGSGFGMDQSGTLGAFFSNMGTEATGDYNSAMNYLGLSSLTTGSGPTGMGVLNSASLASGVKPGTDPNVWSQIANMPNQIASDATSDYHGVMNFLGLGATPAASALTAAPSAASLAAAPSAASSLTATSGVTPSVWSQLGSVPSEVGGWASDAASSVGSAAGGVASSVGDAAGGVASSLGGAASGVAGAVGSFVSGLASLFEEGGYSESPVRKVMTSFNRNDVPHFAQGTHNTSHEIPAILHPNEAVIPLSGNRKVGVEMKHDIRDTHEKAIHVEAHFHGATDMGSFRRNEAQITNTLATALRRQQYRDGTHAD